MSDSNNHLAGRISPQPNPLLRTLDRLVGKWEVSGSFLEGTVSFDWLDGGYYLVQTFDFTAQGERKIKGLEYIGYNEDTGTLRSHMMDNQGSNFTYTWEMDGDTLRIWFGEKGSSNFCIAQFAPDQNSYVSRWQWPQGDGIGGYVATLKRIDLQTDSSMRHDKED